MRRYIRGQIDLEFALGALAANALVSAAVDESVNERSLISSIVVAYSYGEHQPDQGPLVVGVAHSDYSAAEILAYLENSGSWNEGDLPAQEIAKRKVRRIGTFDGTAAQGRLNDGKPIKTKLNWILNTGQTLDFWVLNEDDSVLTTGTDIILSGHANIWPQ